MSADWSEPPAGITPCLRWLADNLRWTYENDRQADWDAADQTCGTLLPELREDLERLHHELVMLGPGPDEMEDIEIRFVAANECFQEAVSQAERWLSEPDSDALEVFEVLLRRGSALLEQADARTEQVVGQNALAVSA